MTKDEIIAGVVEREGGLVDDPDDPGGLTNHGIAWHFHPEFTRQEILNMTPAQAGRIMDSEYWRPIRGDLLPPPVALVVMDAAVHHGVFAATAMLQRSVGVGVDGVVGPRTLRAVADLNVQDICAEFTARRAAAMANSKRNKPPLLGWLRRNIAVYRASLN